MGRFFGGNFQLSPKLPRRPDSGAIFAKQSRKYFRQNKKVIENATRLRFDRYCAICASVQRDLVLPPIMKRIG